MTRFMAKVREHPNGCLEWTAAINQGYGVFSIPKPEDPRIFKTVGAHKWLWEQENGPVPDRMDLDHYLWPEGGCIGRACVRHVRPATRRENLLRGDTIAARNLAKDRCPQGHEYTDENTAYTSEGSRICRACRRAACRDWWRRNMIEQRTV